MFKQKAATLLALIAIAVVFIGAAVVWARIPHRPQQAIPLANRFVDLLRTNELDKAYLLTTRRADVGKTYQEFEAMVRKEWSRHTTGITITDIRVRSVFPFQSNGNRIRRWLRGRPVEMPEVSVDFLAVSAEEGRSVAFEVRETYTGNGEWRVSFFQSHAS